MRVVVWNCAQALERKYAALLALKPDIAVIPESGNPDLLGRKPGDSPHRSASWVKGKSAGKGLSVLSFGKYRVAPHDSWKENFYVYLPVQASGPRRFNLLAVWAFHHRAPAVNGTAAPTLAEVLAAYRPFLSSGPSIVAGDFNSSTIWETPSRPGFSLADKVLQSCGLCSAYHTLTRDPFGRESAPTHFFRKSTKQTYHIDYVYIPKAWCAKARVTVGAASDWIAHSDHAPVIVDV